MDNQTEHFANELDALVNRFRQEYDASYAELLGVLQMKQYLLCQEAAANNDDNTEQEI